MQPAALLKTVLYMARMDFKKRYLGTYIGATWAILSPLVTITLIYFVISFGLKAGNTADGKPFVDWLIPGMLAWFFLSECMNSGTTVILEYGYLVTKMRFPVWTLVPSRMLASMPVHILLMCVFLLVFVIKGERPNIYWLQLLYYLGCSCVLGGAVCLFASAANVFVRDVCSFVGVVTQVLFWATPLFWNPSLIVGTDFEFLLYSPVNYIVSGYRSSIVGVPVWDMPAQAAVFWGITLPLVWFSILFFKRTRPHFADVV